MLALLIPSLQIILSIGMRSGLLFDSGRSRSHHLQSNIAGAANKAAVFRAIAHHDHGLHLGDVW